MESAAGSMLRFLLQRETRALEILPEIMQMSWWWPKAQQHANCLITRAATHTNESKYSLAKQRERDHYLRCHDIHQRTSSTDVVFLYDSSDCPHSYICLFLGNYQPVPNWPWCSELVLVKYWREDGWQKSIDVISFMRIFHGYNYHNSGLWRCHHL